MAEILHAYETYIVRQNEYCVLCLRPATERRLVAPKQFKEYLKSIKQAYDYPDDHQKICFICERQAAVAVRFQTAVEMSRALHVLFMTMVASDKTKKDIYKYIMESNNESESTVMSGWSDRLSRVRAASALLQTEVLLLNMPNKPTSETEVIVNDNSNDNTNDSNAKTSDSNDDVILIQDDYEPATITKNPSHKTRKRAKKLSHTVDCETDMSHVEIRETDMSHVEIRETDVSHENKVSRNSTPNVFFNDALAVERDVLAEPEIYMDSVVIIDEEEDPINSIKAESPPDYSEPPLTPPDPTVIPDSTFVSNPHHIFPNSPPQEEYSILPDLPSHIPDISKTQEFNIQMTPNILNNSLPMMANVPIMSNIPNVSINMPNFSINLPNIGTGLANVGTHLPNVDQNMANVNFGGANVAYVTQNMANVGPTQTMPNFNVANMRTSQVYVNQPTANQVPPKLVPIERLLQQKTQGQANFLLHPIVDINGLKSVPSLSAQIINGQLVIAEKTNLVIQTPKLAIKKGEKIDFICEPTQVTKVLNDLSDSQTNVSVLECSSSSPQVKANPNIVVDGPVIKLANMPQINKNPVILNPEANLKKLSNSNVINNRHFIQMEANALQNTQTVENVRNVSKTVCIDISDDIGESDAKKRKEVPTAKETDWEDKIPMDVISFMHATDPNADESLRTGGPVRDLGSVAHFRDGVMGCITDVRSIADHSGDAATSTGETNQPAPVTTPSQSAATQTAPSRPSPFQPAPSQPAPSQHAPSQPAPSQPAPSYRLNNATQLNRQSIAPHLAKIKKVSVAPGTTRVRTSDSGSVVSWGKNVHIVGVRGKKQ